MATDIPAETKIDVLQAHLDGLSHTVICEQFKLTPDTVRQVLTSNGFPNRAQIQWAIDVYTKDLEVGTAGDEPSEPVPAPQNDDGAGTPGAPSPKVARAGIPAAPAPAPAPVEKAMPAPSSSAAPRPPVLTVTTTPAVCAHTKLLDEARKSTHARTRTQGAKVAALLQELEGRVAKERAARAKKDAARARVEAQKTARAVAAARARQQKRVDEARAQLARIEAEEARIAKEKAAVQERVKAAFERLRNQSVDVPLDPGTPGADVPAKDVRAWAEKAGVEVPAVGRIPKAVRQAYADAHREEGA